MVRFLLNDWVAEDDCAVVWPVYESVFGDYANYETWRGLFGTSTAPGRDFASPARTTLTYLSAFAYGYTGEHGQWWIDNAQGTGA